MSVDPRRGERPLRFISKLLRHSKGEWAGKPFIPATFQAEFVRELFGTVRPDGLRQYRRALLGIPRKNGKSTICAALALYLLIGDDEPGAEVYSAAADKEQARIVFGEASRMVENAPLLARECRVYRNTIEHTPTGSTYRVLSSDVKTKHGLNPHGVVVDELHALPDRELWDVLTTAQAARRQPLTIAITTAGYDRDSLCFELFDYGRKVEGGLIADPTFWFRWYGIEPEADWTDEAQWRVANPLLRDNPRAMEFLRDEFAQAKALPARQNTFRRLYLNQWTEQAERWLDLAQWDGQAGQAEPFEAGRRVWGGIDLASVSDLTSVVWVATAPGGGVDIRHRSFVPEAQLDKAKNPKNWSLYRQFVERGALIVTPGDAVDYERLFQFILDDAHRLAVKGIALDALFQGQWLGQRLVGEGLPVVAMRQGFLTMGPAVNAFERRFLNGELHHGGDPVLRFAVANAVVEIDAAGNKKVSKRKSAEKVDPLVALVMALDQYERAHAALEQRSVYERRGLLFLGGGAKGGE